MNFDDAKNCPFCDNTLIKIKINDLMSSIKFILKCEKCIYKFKYERYYEGGKVAYYIDGDKISYFTEPYSYYSVNYGVDDSIAGLKKYETIFIQYAGLISAAKLRKYELLT